jgi:hypothetical protein
MLALGGTIAASCGRSDDGERSALRASNRLRAYLTGAKAPRSSLPIFVRIATGTPRDVGAALVSAGAARTLCGGRAVRAGGGAEGGLSGTALEKIYFRGNQPWAAIN